MNILTDNMIIVAIVVALIGGLINPFFKGWTRKLILPLVLLLIGAGMMLAIAIFDKTGMYGTACLKGVFASICSQFCYDKYKDMLPKKVDEF